MSPNAASAARVLRRQAMTGLATVPLMLAVAPFLRARDDLAFWLIWPLIVISLLLVLAAAAHLLLDAALFRIIASHGNETLGLSQVDDILERAGLRAKPSTPPRPLPERIAGSRRLGNRLYWLLGLTIALFALLALLPPTMGV